MVPKPSLNHSLNPEKLSDRDILVHLCSCMDTNNEIAASIQTSQKQIIMALIAIVAASIGLKFIGSPPWTILALYMSWLSGAFMILSLPFFWRRLGCKQRILRVLLGGFIWFLAFSRMFFIGETLAGVPMWFQIGLDTCLTILCVFLIVSAWTTDGQP